MKYFIIILLFMLESNTQIEKQNIDVSGTWEGVMFSNTGTEQKSFFIRMELQQKERKIEGFFYTAPTNNISKPEVIYKISSLLNKTKSLDRFTIMKDDLLEFTIPYPIANAFKEFNCAVLIKDSINYMYGKWYTMGTSIRPDGLGGTFQLKHMSSEVGILFEKFRK